MPRYQYRCDTCSQEIEVIQSMNDKPIKKIPATGPCGKKCKSPVTKVMPVPNVNLQQGQTRTTDDGKAKTVEHWDGSKDVTVKPDPVRLKPTMPQGV